MFSRYFTSASLALIISVAISGHALALASPQVPAGASKGAAAAPAKPMVMTATIESIDKTLRLVTLKRADGTLATVYADPEIVKRFDQLKVGDKVSATYYEALAVTVRRPGEPPPTTETGTAIARAGGTMPGATISNQKTATVTVLSMDPKTRAVTVKTQDGRTVSLRVNEQKYFDAVKVGDTVDVTYTEAVLLEVTAAK